MNCPFDATELRIVNRLGVQIDWCPSCKGVWLERGELEKILERADDDDDDDRDRERGRPNDWDREGERRIEERWAPPGSAYRPGPPRDERRTRDEDHYDRPRKKKKSLLAELLDF